MKWFSVVRLGKHTSLTPEGYLLAEGVAVARCGQQIYHHSELPLEPDGDGLVAVERAPAEVFRPESISSFNLKPITNDHPTEEVRPQNWNNLAIGVMTNPRRGEGADDDLLLADLLFTSPVGIQLIKQGKRAVSVGYDAFYEQIAPGMGRQKNIVCNHLALVDVARCGSRCTIMDGAALYTDACDACDAAALVRADHPRSNGYPTTPGTFAKLLRRLLPAAWVADIDYDWRERIDWDDVLHRAAWNDDDWNEALHPRVPAGSGHGGEFTGGGGGGGLGISSGLASGGFAIPSSPAAHAQSVPTPKAAVVQKHGGAKKLAEAVKQHLQSVGDPYDMAATIKAYGNAYVNAGYASYANALLGHVEQAHGLAAGTLGKAKAAAAITGKGAAQNAPTASEMAAMHAAAEADELAPDDDEDSFAPLAVAQSKAANAAGTSPDKLQTIAQNPALLNHLSDSAHKLGINVMGHPTAEAKAAKSEISTWTDPAGYKMIQNHLNGVATSAHAAEVADKLQKAVLSTSLLSDVNTYRGVHGPQLDKLTSMLPGDTWTPKGFSATTLDPKRATHYAKGGQGGDLMHVVLPKGSKALYVSNPDLNSHTAEREMLMPAGSTFKYIGSTTINLPHYDYSGNKVGEGGPVTMHHVEVMQPGSPEFEAAHPRGEGGKFTAKPGSEAEADAHQTAATPPDQAQTAAHKGIDVIASVPGVSPADKISAIQAYMKGQQSLAPESAHQYAATKIFELAAELAAKPASIASPEAMAEAETGVIPEVPSLLKKYGAIANIYGMAKTGATSSQGLEDYLQKSLTGGSIPMGGAAHGYAQTVIAAKKAQEKPGWMNPEPTPTPTPAGPKVPPAAVLAVMTGPDKVTEQLDTLKALKAAAEAKGHDVTEVDAGIKQLQKEHEQALPMPDGSAAQQELWESAAFAGFNHENKIKQIEAEIGGLGGGPTLEYGKQLLAHLKGETYQPAPAAPQGPEPYAGSKGQVAIHEYATHPDPGVTTAEKIAGIKSVMEHPNAGPMTQAFGEQWIAALGGDPNAPAPAATPPPPAAAPPPKPAAPTPTPPKPTTKAPPHYKSKMSATYEDASGNDIETSLVADTKQIPGDLYEKVTAAYGADVTDGNTSAVGYAMHEAAQEAANKFNKLQKTAMISYKGSGYEDINDCVRAVQPCSPATLATIKRIRSTLKEHVIPAHTPCFRGLRASLKDLTGFEDPELATGRAFVHRNFASVSRDRSVAENFGKVHSSYTNSCMMHVTVPAGTPGVVLGGQHKGSEAEIVLPDHCVFRIDRVEVNKIGSADKHTIHCTYMGTQENKDVGQSAV